MSTKDLLCINTLRFLAVDAVEAAKSGHPGLPLGAAPMAHVIWTKFLKHNPANPKWFNRDRFILSAGHGSALLYALLHVTGYDLPLDEIKRFRQWGSKTPGHPEVGHTPGVECTTGPLGQGFTMGVGMAMAEKFLASHFNRKNFPVFDHYVYGLVSDGDLMEGISSEAASLAGHLGLGKIIYLYDDNDISIDGSTELAFTENVPKRFKAYGWHVEIVSDGNDVDNIEKAVRNAQKQTHRPSIIVVKTHIGYGSPKQDHASAHGEPLGIEATRKTKESLDWPLEPSFHIPDEAREHFRSALTTGDESEKKWMDLVGGYSSKYPSLGAMLKKTIQGEFPEGWEETLQIFSSGSSIATRSASGKVLNMISKKLWNLVGGSADLAPSNKTYLSGSKEFSKKKKVGPNIHFGVREHAMSGIANGIALHGGVYPYIGTFLIFSDYMRPSIRMAAMNHLKVLYIFTHDSVLLGEDGPTHQPVEQVMSLRLIPNLWVFRPADANETLVAWKLSVKRNGPTALILTRQDMAIFDAERTPVLEGASRGGYILEDAKSGAPDVLLIATGSEVHLALQAKTRLKEVGIHARVVSMPCIELFNEQTSEYRHTVLLSDVPRVSIEAGSSIGWRDIVGDRGSVIALDRFGASAPGEIVYEQLGFNVTAVVAEVRKLLGK